MRPVAAFFVAFFTLASLILFPSLAPTAAQAAQRETTRTATTPPDSVGITVTPSTSSVLTPGQDLALTLTLHNNTDAAVPVGTVDIYLAGLALTTRTALDSWLRPDKDSNSGDLLLSLPTTEIIPVGASTSLSITVPAASVGLTEQNAWGARGVAAVLRIGETVRAEGRGTFVWSQGSVPTPVAVASIMPITVPAGATGLITAKELESYTSSVGLLTSQLDSVFNAPSLTIAIDPQIIASIRVLGTAAPVSALAWLDRLATASNDIFPLAYADADISLQAQAGATAVLTPTSFDPAIDPSLFVVPAEAPGAEPSVTDMPSVTSHTSSQASATPTPSPTVSPGETVIPTTSDLLAWEYTSTEIAWPAAGNVASSDLDVFAASGQTTTILSSGNVQQSDAFTPNTALTLPTGLGLVSDSALSRAIRTAAEAASDEDWRASMAEAASLLAIVSAENPDSARTLLVTFDRSRTTSTSRVGQTMAALDGLAWANTALLQSALTATPAPTVTFDDESIAASRVAAARSLLDNEAAVTDFATILADPVLITAPQRLGLLALFSTSWTSQSSLWQEQVATSLATSVDLLHAVTVTTRGPIVVVGSNVDLRITLTNALDQTVTVRTEVVPSNGRLVVGDTLATTIQPNSAQAVSVPLSAAVGNGDVVLRVTLFTLTGTPLGQPAPIDVSVRADWEGLGASIFAILVVGFFGFGIWRNIVRRRRENAAEVPAAAFVSKTTHPTEPHV